MGAEASLAEHVIRDCRRRELGQIGAIINAAAQVYRGVIPADCWHDPYMPDDKLAAELDAGVAFQGIEIDGDLVAIMGLQPVQDVSLIRHAYVSPDHQGHGLGSRLLDACKRQASKPVLVGTWAAASWAIGFYCRHGFHQVGAERTRELLRRYWTVPDRQIETSVVLALIEPTAQATAP